MNIQKCAIVGCGAVGATAAYTLLGSGLFNELVLIDINQKKAEGEAMDIGHGVPFIHPVEIYAGTYEDLADAYLVIVTAGANQLPGESRINLTEKNVRIFQSIIPEIVRYNTECLLLIVANPVDILTYAILKVTGLPVNQVIGSGTLLDTARLRSGLSEHFNIAQKNIHAYVFGEHGDTSFVPWSRAFVAGATLDEFDKIVHEDQKDLQPLDREEVLEYVHTSGSTVIAKKGATFYAVAVSVCRLCSLLLAASDTIVSVSTMLHGEYGVEDVCLSTMASIGPEGVKRIVRVPLTEEETEKLHASANALKDVIAQIDL